MKATRSTTRTSFWILWAALLALSAPNVNAAMQSCCSPADEATETAGQACSAHGDLGLPDSATGRMAHAFVDLTYTRGEDALQAFLADGRSDNISRQSGGGHPLCLR